MPRFKFKLSFYPKNKKGKRRFKIILLVFGVVLISAMVFIQFFPKKLSQPPPPIKETKFKEFEIEIPKIGVKAPVIKDVDGAKKSVYNKALEGGVAHYKGTALPEQGSNIFIFGHSSTVLGKGPYATIFARLPELDKGDEIVVYYQNRKFEYTVFEKKIVEKNNMSVLSPTQEEQLTLMTCWPIGSNKKRIIIKGSLKSI